MQLSLKVKRNSSPLTIGLFCLQNELQVAEVRQGISWLVDHKGKRFQPDLRAASAKFLSQ